MKKRCEIKPEYQWDLCDIYPTIEAWEKNLMLVKKTYIPQIRSYSGLLHEEEKVLTCLQLNDELELIVEKLCAYAHMKSDENQADSQSFELSSRGEALWAETAEASSFIEPELLAENEELLILWMNLPSFKDYKQFLKSLLKMKAHTLSREEEAILAGMSDLTSITENIYVKVTAADMIFPKIKDTNGQEIQLSSGRYLEYLQNQDQDFRQRAYEGILSSYEKQINTLAVSLNGQVKRDIYYAKVRNYSSALAAALDKNHIPRSVYDNLVQAVNKHLDVLHQYIALRKKILKVEKVHHYDLFVPLVDSIEKKVSYDQAKDMVLAGLAPLGKEYVQTFAAGLNNHWVDVFTTENKGTGAYACQIYGVHPYILLNHDDTVDGMLTLAHEGGHAMHFYYSNKTQPHATAEVPIFTTEVASTANELLMMDYLIEQAASKPEKIYYINQLIDTIRVTFFSQVMYAEFEQQIHEWVEKGGALSPDTLNNMWHTVLEKYNGADFTATDIDSIGWARIPHFYYDFYVYQYATSIAAANLLSQEIRLEKNGAVEKYIDFLRAGSNEYPVEILKKAGVDMLSPDSVEALLVKFKELVLKLEALLSDN